MKLSKYIAGLQKIFDINGDLDCYYAIDDEGNGYQQVNYDGSLYFVSACDINSYRPELYCEEDVADGEIKNPIKVCVVN